MATNDAVSGIKSETDYAAQRAKTGIDDARSTVKDAANTYGKAANDVADSVQHGYQDAKEIAQRNLGDIEQQIRDKPVQSTLIAAGIGFLIGMLLSR